MQEPIEVFSRLISGEWYARSIGAFSAGRFTDEHDTSTQLSIQFAEHRTASAHVNATLADCDLAHELRKLNLLACVHCTLISTQRKGVTKRRGDCSILRPLFRGW
jgi:hypothetical protein